MVTRIVKHKSRSHATKKGRKLHRTKKHLIKHSNKTKVVNNKKYYQRRTAKGGAPVKESLGSRVKGAIYSSSKFLATPFRAARNAYTRRRRLSREQRELYKGLERIPELNNGRRLPSDPLPAHPKNAGKPVVRANIQAGNLYEEAPALRENPYTPVKEGNQFYGVRPASSMAGKNFIEEANLPLPSDPLNKNKGEKKIYNTVNPDEFLKNPGKNPLYRIVEPNRRNMSTSSTTTATNTNQQPSNIYNAPRVLLNESIAPY